MDTGLSSKKLKKVSFHCSKSEREHCSDVQLKSVKAFSFIVNSLFAYVFVSDDQKSASVLMKNDFFLLCSYYELDKNQIDNHQRMLVDNDKALSSENSEMIITLPILTLKIKALLGHIDDEINIYVEEEYKIKRSYILERNVSGCDKIVNCSTTIKSFTYDDEKNEKCYFYFVNKSQTSEIYAFIIDDMCIYRQRAKNNQLHHFYNKVLSRNEQTVSNIGTENISEIIITNNDDVENVSAKNIPEISTNNSDDENIPETNITNMNIENANILGILVKKHHKY